MSPRPLLMRPVECGSRVCISRGSPSHCCGSPSLSPDFCLLLEPLAHALLLLFSCTSPCQLLRLMDCSTAGFLSFHHPLEQTHVRVMPSWPPSPLRPQIFPIKVAQILDFSLGIGPSGELGGHSLFLLLSSDADFLRHFTCSLTWPGQFCCVMNFLYSLMTNRLLTVKAT